MLLLQKGLTALHLAAKYARPVVVNALLGYGAPVDITGGIKDKTPLHFSAQLPATANGELLLLLAGKFGVVELNS